MVPCEEHRTLRGSARLAPSLDSPLALSVTCVDLFSLLSLPPRLPLPRECEHGGVPDRVYPNAGHTHRHSAMLTAQKWGIAERQGWEPTQEI